MEGPQLEGSEGKGKLTLSRKHHVQVAKWIGFVSNLGTEKVCLQAAKKLPYAQCMLAKLMTC